MAPLWLAKIVRGGAVFALGCICAFGVVTTSRAQEHAELGAIRWATASSGALEAKFLSAIGLYVKVSQTVLLTFYTKPLSGPQRRYWLQSNAARLRGRYENKDFVRDAQLDAELKTLGEESITLWVMLANMSKHAPSARPEVHSKADLSGVLLCVGLDCRHYSGGVYGDEYVEQIDSLQLPTPSSALSSATARVEAQIKKMLNDGPTNMLQIRADIPMTVVTD
jgi:hypothetical protein